MNLSTLPLFIITSALLIATPGPNWIYILTRGTTQGRLAAIVSAIGLGCGVLFHTMAAALGLSAVLHASQPLFLAIKYAGGIYLIYLGVKALRKRDTPLLQRALKPSLQAGDLIRQSITQSLLNPKTALFFLTFLPQFVQPGSASPAIEMVKLGAVYMLLTMLIYGTLGFFSGSIGDWLRTRPLAASRFRFVTAGAFIGLGVWALLPERR